MVRTVYPKKYAHGFVVLCFVVVMQSFIVNSHEVFIHIHQGCFAGTGAIVRLPQCQWSKPDGYGKISQCKTTTKHSKAKTVCIFLGIYCIMACRLFGANCYLNQRWCIVNLILWSTYKWKFQKQFPYKIASGNVVWRISTVLSWHQYVKGLSTCYRYSRRIPTIVFLVSAGISLAALAFVQYWGEYFLWYLQAYSHDRNVTSVT